MAGDIYELVNKATQANSKMGKVQLGYTVDTYKGVLEQLQKTQAALANVKQTPTGAAGTNTTSKAIFDRWTLMGEIEVSNAISKDGFVVKAEDFDDVFTYRQIQCMIKPYMSFVVNLTDAQGKELTYFAQFNSHDQTLNNGTSVAAGGKSTYPMYNMDTSTCETIGTALGDMKTPFEMGIGVDITDESGCIDKFFKRCYPQVYKTGIGAKLVKNRAIFAEVSFPNGNKAKTLNVRVIADSKTPKGSYQFLYFPVPLLLSSDYNTLGVVTIKDGTVKTVGKDCKSPLENSTFDHQDAELSDFTPQLLKDILINKRVVTEANVTFDTASVADDNNIPHNVCYVRFYLDKTKEQAIKDIIGDIPSEYQSEIYKGVEEAKMSEKFIGWEDSVSAYQYSVSGDVVEFWKNVGMQLVNQVDGKKLLAAVEFVGDKESKSEGGWAAWGICGKGDGDGEGVSAGKFQFTQRAGGIKVWLQKFLQRNGKISAGFQNTIQTSLTGNTKGKYAKLTRSEAQPLLEHITEWQNISATKEGQLAQCDTWLQEKGHKTIKQFNVLNCSSAAEFGAILGAINHLPGNGDLMNKFKSDIIAIGSSFEKAKFIEKLHWAGVWNYKKSGKCNSSCKDCVKTKEEIDAVDESFISKMVTRNSIGWISRYTESIKKWKELS